jgi:phosphoenolpyruvate-protein kinase (PTS system EI component)
MTVIRMPRSAKGRATSAPRSERTRGRRVSPESRSGARSSSSRRHLRLPRADQGSGRRNEIQRFRPGAHKGRADLKDLKAEGQPLDRRGVRVDLRRPRHDRRRPGLRGQGRPEDRARSQRRVGASEVKEELEARFESFDNEYLRDRGEDVKDVGEPAEQPSGHRAARAFGDRSRRHHLADDLTPSDAVHFNQRPIVGFATKRAVEPRTRRSSPSRCSCPRSSAFPA